MSTLRNNYINPRNTVRKELRTRAKGNNPQVAFSRVSTLHPVQSSASSGNMKKGAYTHRRRMLEHLILLPEVLVQLEDGGDVAAAVAIVWRAPDGDDRVVEHKLEALHRELMRPRNEVDVVVVCKRLGDVRAEEESRAAWREAPAGDI